MQRTGLFPGTFDPVTMGHLDVLRRALHLFDRIVMAVSESHRATTFFTAEERIGFIEESLTPEERRRVDVRPFRGLLVDFAKEMNATAVVRGMRFVSDFEYELQMAQMNQKLRPELVTIFLTPSERYSSLNATLVKEIALNGGPVRGLVPPHVAARLRKEHRDRKAAEGSRRPSGDSGNRRSSEASA